MMCFHGASARAQLSWWWSECLGHQCPGVPQPDFWQQGHRGARQKNAMPAQKGALETRLPHARARQGTSTQSPAGSWHRWFLGWEHRGVSFETSIPGGTSLEYFHPAPGERAFRATPPCLPWLWHQARSHDAAQAGHSETAAVHSWAKHRHSANHQWSQLMKGNTTGLIPSASISPCFAPRCRAGRLLLRPSVGLEREGKGVPAGLVCWP